MQGFKVFLLLLISILLIISGWVYLAGMSVERTVLSIDYYHHLANETELVSAVHGELQTAMPEIMLEGMLEDFDEDITEEEERTARTRIGIVVKALTRAFDSDWMKIQLLSVIEDFLALIKGEQEELSVVIDLREQKTAFRQELIDEFETLPEEIREKLDMPPEAIELMADQFLTEMDLPGELQLTELLAADGFSQEVDEAVTVSQNYLTMFSYWPYIVFTLLLVFNILLAGPLGGLKWFGAAVLVFSLTFLVGLQVVRGAFPEPLLGGIEAELPLSLELLSSIVGYTVARASTIPLVSAAVGLVLLLGAVIYGKMKPNQ